MNIEAVKSLFTVFSGEELNDAYDQIIRLAVSETEKMLVPGCDTSDIRLEFLCAAAANYRLQQINAAHDRSGSVYAGSMTELKSGKTALAYAEKLLSDYMNMCADIIVPRTFMFITTGKETAPDA